MTAAFSLDLPPGPLPVAERLSMVRAMNLLPQPAQRRVARQVYQRRARLRVPPRPERAPLLGAVLALADGVGLAIGAMTWERTLSIGILADAALVPDADRLGKELIGVFQDFHS